MIPESCDPQKWVLILQKVIHFLPVHISQVYVVTDNGLRTPVNLFQRELVPLHLLFHITLHGADSLSRKLRAVYLCIEKEMLCKEQSCSKIGQCKNTENDKQNNQRFLLPTLFSALLLLLVQLILFYPIFLGQICILFVLCPVIEFLVVVEPDHAVIFF